MGKRGDKRRKKKKAKNKTPPEPQKDTSLGAQVQELGLKAKIGAGVVVGFLLIIFISLRHFNPIKKVGFSRLS
jgi:F0F1-type ATP synthase assembly protein I